MTDEVKAYLKDIIQSSNYEQLLRDIHFIQSNEVDKWDSFSRYLIDDEILDPLDFLFRINEEQLQEEKRMRNNLK